MNPSVKGPASGRRVLLYFPWSRPGETGAKILDIDDRFPAIFELRRIFFPTFEGLSDPAKVDQGIAGFLDHVQKPNFTAFIEQAEKQTGHGVMQIERVMDDGTSTLLDDAVLTGIDTIVVISFDSFRTAQTASASKCRRFADSSVNPTTSSSCARITTSAKRKRLRVKCCWRAARPSTSIMATAPHRRNRALAVSQGRCSPDLACRSTIGSVCTLRRCRTGYPRPSKLTDRLMRSGFSRG
jgi:hypothetical protein